ncbi:MAG TPA: DUF2232 domain-containing protein [Symbiobacteriaceae bacterium]|nr:DUF2232 domain-containing protein [Symbiobacteriaceae bacterium]
MARGSAGARGLVFGGIMAALVLLCALVPVLGILMPVPLVLSYVRYGGRVAALAGVVAALLTAMFKGPISAFLLTVPGGILPGLALGYGFHRKLRPMTIGVLAVLIFVVGFAAEYAVTRIALFDGRDPIAVTLQTEPIKSEIDRTLDRLERTLVAAEPADEQQKERLAHNLAFLAEVRRDPVAISWSGMGASLLFIGTITTWWNYTMCRLILPRLGHDVPQPQPFSHFSLPAWTVWLFTLASAGVLYLGNSLLTAPWWVKVAVNVAGPLQVLLLMAGLAAAYGFLRMRWNLDRPVAILLSVTPLLLLRGAGMQLYMMLAMVDTFLDFRGLGHGLWKRPQGTS